MCGCISIEILYMYKLKMFIILAACISGWVCVPGGLLCMILIIFLWVLCSGWRYSLFDFSCPYIVIPYIRCGYMNE